MKKTSDIPAVDRYGALRNTLQYVLPPLGMGGIVLGLGALSRLPMPRPDSLAERVLNQAAAVEQVQIFDSEARWAYLDHDRDGTIDQLVVFAHARDTYGRSAPEPVYNAIRDVQFSANDAFRDAKVNPHPSLYALSGIAQVRR